MNKIASITPVTALASVEFEGKTFLLSGESNILKVWELGVKEPVAKKTIDSLSTIHGIHILLLEPDPEISEYLLVIWGDHVVVTLLLSLLSEGPFSDRVELRSDFSLDLADRIFHLVSLPPHDIKPNAAVQIVAVSANNGLFFLSWPYEEGREEKTFSLLHSVQGPSYALYSASILVLNERIFVAAGSVFGDVVLWCVSNASSEVISRTPTLIAEIHAHEGSVFDVKLRALTDPESGPEKLLLASCSDDRTVALYEIDIQPEGCLAGIQQNVEALPRTGFAPPALDSEEGVELIARVPGHLSRIWRVDFLPRSNQIPDLISFGEDATIQFWHRIEESNGKSTFMPGTSWAAHLGKSIWAEVVRTSEDGTVQVFTGGADGGIRALTVSSHGLENSNLSSSCASSNGGIKNFCWSGDRNLLAITAEGMVASHHLFDDSRLQVNLNDADSISGPFRGIGSIGNIIVFESDELILCSIGNRLHSYNTRDRSFAEIYTFDRKIMQILKAEDFYSRSFGTPKHYVLLKLAGESPYSFVELHMNYEHIEVAAFMKLDLSHEVILTSASIILSHLSIALLGCRDGAIRLMHYGNSGEWKLYRAFPGIHRCDAVTDIGVLVNLGPDEPGFRWIMSTGRNGTVGVHRLVITSQFPDEVDLDGSDDVDLRTMNNSYVPFGPFIEGIKQVELDGIERIVVWGFHGSHFIVWDMLHQQELLSVDCGGAARKWSFHLTEYGMGFMWMKASRLYVVKQRKLALQSFQPGLHGREIKAIATRRLKLIHGQLIATAAEDTTISFTLARESWNSNLKALEPCAVAIGHNTGPQEVKFVARTDLLLSSGGLEEFFVWGVNEIPKLCVGTVLLGRCPPATPEKDLRIMGFDTYLEYSIFGSGRDVAYGLCAVVAYSDSSVRLWRITVDSKASFRLLALRNIGTNCLTAAKFVNLTGWLEDPPVFIITAGTDGCISVLEIPQGLFYDIHGVDILSLTDGKRQKIHKGSIQVQKLCRIYDVPYLVTAGDDGALALTRLAKSHPANGGENVGTLELDTVIIENAHAASINGMIVCGEPRMDGEMHLLEIISLSKDQKIKVWELYIPARGEGKSLHESKIELQIVIDTSIADAACLEQYENEFDQKRAVVAGVGLELWIGASGPSPG